MYNHSCAGSLMLIPLWQKLRHLAFQRNIQKILAPTHLPRVGVVPCILSLWKSRDSFCCVLFAVSGKQTSAFKEAENPMRECIELLWSAGWIGYFSFPGEILPWSSPYLSVQTHRLPGVCRWLFALFTLSLCQHGFRVQDRKGCPRLFCLSLLPLPTCRSFTEKRNKDAGLKLSSSHMQA